MIRILRRSGGRRAKIKLPIGLVVGDDERPAKIAGLAGSVDFIEAGGATPSATFTRIGPNVTVGAGSSVEDAVIRDAIIGDNTTIAASSLHDSIVGDNSAVRGIRGSVQVGDDAEVLGGEE